MTHEGSPNSQPNQSGAKSVRLYYLDWLRVLAILGVFLFHAIHPFDYADWHIKNAEQSMAVTLLIAFLYPWGMPFFFLIAGTGSWFALRRRTGRRYIGERFQRLLVPFFTGALLLTPIQLVIEWTHKTQTGAFEGSLPAFIASREVGFSPQVFGWAGYHLWFLGYLFAFSVVALPIFLWLKGDAGQRFTSRLVRLCQWRGGLLVFFLPLIAIQIALRPLFPQEHDWADFLFRLAFFIYGYILFSDERFRTAIRRDWLIVLVVGIVFMLLFLAMPAFGNPLEWMITPGIPQYYLFWIAFGVDSWCWTIFVLYLGMRYLDFTNRWLEYGQEAILPFFVLHQPVILFVAFFVVQWDASIFLKLLTVVLGSFAVTLALYELVIRRVGFLRTLFGMKTSAKTSVSLDAGHTPATSRGTADREQRVA